MKQYIIEANALQKTYPTKPPVTALQGFSLSVERGETVGILGPNGAGKTTFIRILLGILLPDSGEITVGDANPVTSPKKVARQIRFVPELPFLNSNWTLWQNARYWFSVWEESWIPEKVKEMLIRFHLIERADEPLSRYSRGMQQRAGLALALASTAPVIVMDEPTLGLDVLGVQEMLEILENTKDQGKTVLFASHDMHFVEKLADRVALVAKGQVLETSTTYDFRKRYGQEYVTLRYKLPALDEIICEQLPVDASYSDERTWRRIMKMGGTLIELRRDLQSLDMVVGHYLQQTVY
jgi:ABC-2 type transport system ATP-binding protein